MRREALPARRDQEEASMGARHVVEIHEVNTVAIRRPSPKAA
jgi:hypothetical protein